LSLEDVGGAEKERERERETNGGGGGLGRVVGRKTRGG